MKKLTSRRITALTLSALMAGSLAGAGLTRLPAGNTENGSTGSAIAQPVASDKKGGVLFEEVTENTDTSALFTQYYNPDVVKVNDLVGSEERVAIVMLKADPLLDYALDAGMNYASFFQTAAARKAERAVEGKIDSFVTDMRAAGIKADVLYTYKTLATGVAVRATGTQLNAIAKLKGVDSVVLSEHYDTPKVIEISNDTNVYSTGIYNTSQVDPSLRGDGMVIAVLDTGMDIQHAAFGEDNFYADTLTLTKEKVESLTAKLLATRLDSSANAHTLYKSSKLPYGFDYADKDTNVYPSYSSHGVHVSGIIAGNHTEISQDIVDSDDDLKFDYDDEKGTHYFEGVVPDAQIVTMKVFTDNVDAESLGGADTEDILAALEDAVTLGVDVINMSLGSSAGFSSYADDYMKYVYDRIEEAGISLVCAASNDYSSGYGGVNGTNLTSNPDSATVGSPSTYPASISVASINGQKDPYMLANKNGKYETMVFYTEASDGNSNKMDFVGDIFERLKAQGKMANSATSIELPYVVIPGLGRSYNYSESIKQKLKSQPTIALVQRGTNTFEEKMKIAKENGALAIMIYNNVAGGISMTMGAKDKNDIIPSCSVSMDIGNNLVLGAVNSTGTIVLDQAFHSGPFMSEFSSWGPTPSLQLKPEITAYGGNVTSAVAGGYDVYSGTSMASPNMAGAVAIIRQNLKKQHPDWTSKQVHDRAYQIMMSTAGIVLDQTGDPYSPRKQGAGIADIEASLTTQSYLYVKNGEKVSPKTKIELYDDPARTGKYSFTFYIENISDAYAMYSAKSFVMTETVSSDGKTVAEKSLILSDAEVSFTVNGSKTERVGLDGGDTATVQVTITLSEANKKYLNDNFKNGMFVEGYIVLTQTISDTDALADLSIPFLAFYGDWTDAPILDYSSYEVAENEADDSIPDEDKFKIEFFSTAPYSKYGEKYIFPMGQYLYRLSDSMDPIYTSEDKAAISRYNEPLHSTAYEFYAVYAGLLRGMAVCNAKIVNEYTGEVVWQDQLTNIAKGYAAGGSNRPGFVKIEFNPAEMNLPGNTQYHFYMEGFLDYGDGTKGNKNTFDFGFYTDYEKPTLVDVGLRYEDYVDLNEDVHTRIYLDVTTFDNHYTQAILLLYVDGDNTLNLLQEYVTPVYSEERSRTITTSIEITDCYEQYFSNMRIQLEDYAMNSCLYSIDLTKAIKGTFPERLSFEGEKLEMTAGSAVRPELIVTPASAQHYDLIWKSTNENVVRVEKGEFYAVGVGEAYVYVYASNTTTLQVPSARIKVVVSEGTDTNRYAQPEFDLIYNKSGVPVNPTNTTVEVHPNEEIALKVKSNPWYMPAAKFEWSSQNELVATVDQNGVVHTLKEGVAIITANQVGTGGVLSVSVTLSVGPEFVISSYILTEYHGVGGDVVVPEELNFMYIDDECFLNDKTITSFVVPEDVTQIYEKAFYGCSNLRYIKFPKSLTLVEESAFEGCTSLETIDMTDALSVIFSHRCFYGCSSLKEIVNDERLTAIWDYTFAGCSSLRELNLSNLVQVGKYSFANCTGLQSITASRYTEIGEGMFFGCTSLESLTLPVEYVGKNAFFACSKLSTVALTGQCVLDEGAFRDCSSLDKLFFVGNVYEIGERAFEGCKSLRVLVLPDNAVSIAKDAFTRCNSLYTLGVQENTLLYSPEAFRNCGSWEHVNVAKTVQNANGEYDFEFGGVELKHYSVDGTVLYNKNQTEIVLIPVGAQQVQLPATLKSIGDGAFYGLTALHSVVIPEGVTQIGDFAFSYSGVISVNIPASVQSLGKGAFAYCYQLENVSFAANSKITHIPEGCFNTTYELTSIALPSSIVAIDAYAFGASSIQTIYAQGGTPTAGLFDGSGFTALKTIGDSAFGSSSLKSVSLPATLETLGDYAFSACASLEDVEFNSNVAMGSFTFMDATHMSYVKFDASMSDIGSYTFVSMTGNPGLKEVVLPANLTAIGAYAFWGCEALTKIGYEHGGNTVKGIPADVVEIGDYAFFRCAALTELDLSNVRSFGDSAFAEAAALAQADLTNAEYIGAYAFYMSGIDSVTLTKVVTIEEGGIAYTNITSLDLPSTLQKLGGGAFHYNFYLTGISIGESEKFFIDELDEEGYGVLYSRLPGGSYQVEAYPGANPAKKYEVLEGTTRVAEMAFTGSTVLNEVVLPVSLETIGDKGFYDCRADFYEFKGFRAPNLEARFIDGDSYSSDEFMYTIYARNGEYSDERFYANFYFYAMYSVYFNEDFGLTITYPVNGEGYDEYIWKLYFSDSYLGAETADRNTLNAIKAVQAIDFALLDALAGASAQDAAAKATAVSLTQTLKLAYGYYRNILSDTQLEFFTGKFDNKNYEDLLTDAQKKMQSIKEKFGIVSEITALRIRALPKKTAYEFGETIDFTGLVVAADYDDGMSGVITDYTVDRTVANVSGSRVRINVAAGGKTASFYISVSEEPEADPPKPVKKGCRSSADAMLALLVGTLTAGGVTLLVLFKKGGLRRKERENEGGRDE